MIDVLRTLLTLIGAGVVFAAIVTWGLRFGLRFRPPAPQPLTDAEILRVAREGDLITAIRWHRELHETDFVTAKAKIESMLAQYPGPTPQSQE